MCIRDRKGDRHKQTQDDQTRMGLGLPKLQGPLPPPKHAITPWHQPVHDHMVHGPLPGSSTSSSHIILHHDPEPAVYEDSAPAFIPRSGVAKMSGP